MKKLSKSEEMRRYREGGGARVEARRLQQKKTLIDGLKSVPCMDCGQTFPPECMDFDHVRGTKRFNLNAARYRRLVDVMDEIAKCDIVCSNCHRIRTHRRRG